MFMSVLEFPNITCLCLSSEEGSSGGGGGHWGLGVGGGGGVGTEGMWGWGGAGRKKQFYGKNNTIVFASTSFTSNGSCSCGGGGEAGGRGTTAFGIRRGDLASCKESLESGSAFFVYLFFLNVFPQNIRQHRHWRRRKEERVAENTKRAVAQSMAGNSFTAGFSLSVVLSFERHWLSGGASGGRESKYEIGWRACRKQIDTCCRGLLFLLSCESTALQTANFPHGFPGFEITAAAADKWPWVRGKAYVRSIQRDSLELRQNAVTFLPNYFEKKFYQLYCKLVGFFKRSICWDF